MTRRLLATAHAIALNVSAPEWVQLIPAGSFSGRDGRGPYRLSDPEAVIRASLSEGNGLPIDYDHQIDLAAVEGVGGTAPAAGWLVELEARDGSLWGRVEWTDKGRAAVESREYRFLSPVFLHAREDGEIGQLLRAALTNTPNLDLVALNARRMLKESVTMDLLDQLIAAFGWKADTDAEEALANLKALQAEAGALGALTTALAGKPVDLAPVLAAQEGTARDAALEGLVTAIMAKRAPEPGADARDETIMALQAKVNQLEAADARRAAETAVEKAVQAGKIAPAVKEWALSYAARDPKGFEEYVAKMHVVVDPKGRTLGAPPPKKDGALSDNEKAICRAMGVTEDEYRQASEAEDA